MWSSIHHESGNSHGEAPEDGGDTTPFKRDGNQGRLMILAHFRLGGTTQGKERVIQEGYFLTDCNPVSHKTIT